MFVRCSQNYFVPFQQQINFPYVWISISWCMNDVLSANTVDAVKRVPFSEIIKFDCFLVPLIWLFAFAFSSLSLFRVYWSCMCSHIFIFLSRIHPSETKRIQCYALSTTNIRLFNDLIKLDHAKRIEWITIFEFVTFLKKIYVYKNKRALKTVDIVNILCACIELWILLFTMPWNSSKIITFFPNVNSLWWFRNNNFL